MKKVQIEGMHCAHCAARVEKALATFGKARVDLNGGYATVETAAADVELKNAVEDLGFDVTKVETL